MIMRRQLFFLLYKDVFLSINDINMSLPSASVSILQKFGDLFPKEILDGLSFIRDIEHQIDFILGFAIPNCLAYRANLKKTKEI